MNIKRYIAVIVFLILGFYSCIEPFTPDVSEEGKGYLVIDGFLNIGNDTNYIKLSRTLNIQDNSQSYEKVTYSTVTVICEDGTTYPYQDLQNGTYRLLPQDFDVNKRYRLSIKTYQGKTYESAFVSVSKTPDIDSISYRVDDYMNSVVINVNTHDKTNSTWFYRWNFEETHRYSSPHYSSLIWIGSDSMIPRTERIDMCWKTETSKHILLGSTVKQTESTILSLPINNTPISTNKFLDGYSILVRQYGLTHEAFEYWTTLAKTTQGTGSLFDPLPSLVTGNIRNTNDNSDLVFGYFSAGEEKTKRLFISQRLGSYERCPFPIDTLNLDNPEVTPDVLQGYLFIDFTDESRRNVYATTPTCADCRLRGGTTTKPTFWP